MTSLDDIAETLKEMRTYQNEMKVEVATIKRGIYGDRENGVKGLIETDREQHARIVDLEQTKSKALWVGGGILVSIEVGWQFIKHKFGL